MELRGKEPFVTWGGVWLPDTWPGVKKYYIIKFIHARHHIFRFVRGSLVLKINLKTGQIPGTMAEGRKKNIWLSLKDGPDN